MATLMIGDVVASDPGRGNTQAVVSDDTEVHRLLCSRHKINSLRGEKCVWCVHMDLLIRKGLDAKQIDAIVEPTPVTVPLRPTANLWAGVVVEGMHHAGMHEVALPLTGDAVAHIGIIALGEGRRAIRLMLWDYLQHAYMEVPGCGAPIHRHADFRPGFTRHDEPTPEDVLNTFSVLTTGFCIACAPFTNFDDDIPEI